MRLLPRDCRCKATAIASLAATLMVVPVAVAASAALDPTFGTGGKVTTDFGASEHLSAVAGDGNGSVVAAGTTIAPDGTADVAVARYRSDGTLDATFGGDGRVTTNLGLYDFA